MIDAVRPVSLAVGVAATVLLTAFAPSLRAQCSNPWPAVPGSMGVEGSVTDMLVFDPDGAGPIGERILVSGAFAVAGKAFAQNLALYDPIARTWAAFGPGPYPANLRLAVTDNGDLYVGGKFTSIAGVAAANVARWDGIAWSPLGSGVTGSSSYYTVQFLTAVVGGGIAVTGSITTAGGNPANGIARWDGSGWSSLGATSLAGTVTFESVTSLPNGNLWAVAQQTGGPTPFAGVLAFDGSGWSQLGTPLGKPLTLRALPSGEVLAGGNQGVARWNGTSWLLLPGVPLREVWDFEVLSNGLLAATGRPAFVNEQRVTVWDGLHWVTIGDSALDLYGGVTSVLTRFGNDLFVGGSFSALGGAEVRSVARWDGTTWSATGPGLAVSTRWLATQPNGSIFVGASLGSLDAGLVRRWTGVGWASIGGGYYVGTGSNPMLAGLFAMPGGRLISTGRPQSNTTSPMVQQWTGTSWTTLATSTFGVVNTAVELANGDLVVGGQFSQLSGTTVTNVGRFDGVSWSPLGVGLQQVVSALVVTPGGDLIALGTYSVFRWNGAIWVQVGLSLPGIPKALTVAADGALVVAGDFTGADVLRWNGGTWAPLGTGPAGPVQSLCVMPGGDLVAGPIGVGRSLERWDGGSWTPLGGSIDGTVWSLAVAANGDLLLAGDFTVADGAVRPRFARVSTSCPASVVAVPSGCGSVALELSTQTLPWIGGVCRTTVTTAYTVPLIVIGTGLQGTSLPLDAVLGLPAGACTLLVLPLGIDARVPVAGRVDQQFNVPDSPAMIGTPVLQQAVALFADASGSFTSATASNALVFVTGSF